MGKENRGGSEGGGEHQAVRKPYVVVPKKWTGKRIRSQPKTGIREPYVVVPKEWTGNRIRIQSTTEVRKPGSFERRARSLRIERMEMPTAAAELTIRLIPSESQHSSHTEENNGSEGPDMPMTEDSS